MLAIIGGTTYNDVQAMKGVRREIIRTPYGEPSCALTFGELCGEQVVFMARHGYGYTLAPHEINYRANMWALHAQGVDRVIAIVSAGGIRSDLVPGTFVVPDQIIDYTSGRANTYHEGGQKVVEYVDFTHPYDKGMRQTILEATSKAGVDIVDGGVYAATSGPRLETAAEIRRIERDGGDMVGMTGMPEASLARELKLAYAAVVIITNDAAGKGSSLDNVTFKAASYHNGEAAKVKMLEILENIVCHC